MNYTWGFFFKIYLVLDKRGREGERERNINAWLPHTHQWGTWPATQACALAGNQTGDPSNHWATPARAVLQFCFFFKKLNLNTISKNSKKLWCIKLLKYKYLITNNSCLYIGHSKPFPSVSKVPAPSQNPALLANEWVQGKGLPSRSLELDEEGETAGSRHSCHDSTGSQATHWTFLPSYQFLF